MGNSTGCVRSPAGAGKLVKGSWNKKPSVMLGGFMPRKSLDRRDAPQATLMDGVGVPLATPNPYRPNADLAVHDSESGAVRHAPRDARPALGIDLEYKQRYAGFVSVTNRGM